jgi:hypothetical protein
MCPLPPTRRRLRKSKLGWSRGCRSRQPSFLQLPLSYTGKDEGIHAYLCFRPIFRQVTRSSNLGEKPCVYRLLIIVRVVIFVLFFKWRISTCAMSTTADRHGTSKSTKAMCAVSIAGELWFRLDVDARGVPASDHGCARHHREP